MSTRHLRNAAAAGGPSRVCRGKDRGRRRKPGRSESGSARDVACFGGSILRNCRLGAAAMNAPANLPRILLIDSNVYFSKRLGDALKGEGFEVVPSTQAVYALTMLEYDAPMAILCATNLREMGALEMAPILRADPKTAHIPLIAVGGGGDQALLEAYGAGCDDYV